MSDEFIKARDEAAEDLARCTLSVECTDAGRRLFIHGAKKGADWAINYERERSKKLLEALKDMIRNSRDIVAKKQCSDYLALYEAGGVK